MASRLYSQLRFSWIVFWKVSWRISGLGEESKRKLGTLDYGRLDYRSSKGTSLYLAYQARGLSIANLQNRIWSREKLNMELLSPSVGGIEARAGMYWVRSAFFVDVMFEGSKARIANNPRLFSSWYKLACAFNTQKSFSIHINNIFQYCFILSSWKS